MSDKLPEQRWQMAAPEPEKISELIRITALLPLMARVLCNRGIETSEQAKAYVDPESQELPSPLEEFPDLKKSVDLLEEAIVSGEKIAICGDYDADGMTSTALLLRALRYLGADVTYAIPSRMKDGYGINNRIVEDFANENVGLILTVDNGISAFEPIELAIELGMNVIITDHHEPPEKLPPADAILNPKLIESNSPYRGLAGVGVAYILAVSTARSLGKIKGLTSQLLELFTLGTIADLAPLVGVNRRWLRRGLRKLPKSELPGIQALMQMAGISEAQKKLKPDDIGFRLGPRINAVGRIGDPQIVIDLLSGDDPGMALEKAMQCEQTNVRRQQLCQEIEKEAIELIENTPIQWQRARVLAIVRAGWHHGTIGIVASRLVERYGVPVFIGTYEEDDPQKVRGSARGIPEFNVYHALEFCRDLLSKFGGHQAAGGFGLPSKNLEAFEERLSEFAHQCLRPEHLKPLVKIDALANFEELTDSLYRQIDSLQPWGIGNEFPVFWTPNVRVSDRKVVGKNHLKLTLAQDNGVAFEAIAWHWAGYHLPPRIDVAYKLQENQWNGSSKIELEIVGARPPAIAVNGIKKATFEHQGRCYDCTLRESLEELRIGNDRGKVLVVNKGKRIALLGESRDKAKEVDVTQPPYYQLVKAALAALDKVQAKS